jgi:transcriptional regulator with XRE-family HTH domain
VVNEFRAGARVRRIGRKVRAWREGLSLTGAAAAKEMNWSPAKLSKLENAAQPIQAVDVLAFGLAFHIDEQERTQLYYDALRAAKPGWWQAYDENDLAEVARDYVELESEASVLRSFKLDLIPGILQTPEYAAAIMRAALPEVSDEMVRRRIEIRDRRQDRLRAEQSLRVDAVLTEAVLRTEIGGPDVLRDQLARLVKLAEMPNVTIRIIPFSAGAYPAIGSPFTVLAFDEEHYDDVAYLESIGYGLLFEDPATVRQYMLNFVGVQSIALSPQESSAMLVRAAEAAGR